MIQTRIARMRSLAMPTAFRRRSILFAAEVANKAVAREVVWVYAVAAGLDRERLAGLAGVGGEPVRTIAEADIHAVVGSVDAASFGESSIASMLGDLADIEPIGRAHHEVVATIAADSPVVPLRLARSMASAAHWSAPASSPGVKAPCSSSNWATAARPARRVNSLRAVAASQEL